MAGLPFPKRESHIKLAHTSKEGVIIFPNHGSQEIGRGIGKKNIETSGYKIELYMKKKIIFQVEKTNTGFSAFTDEYPIYTLLELGRNVLELINNTYEAVDFYAQEEKVRIKSENVSFQFDFRQFFKDYKVINAKYLGERIGMSASSLSQYVSGNKIPSARQTEKILNGIHRIGQELAGVNLLLPR
ncbi:MAG: hypothetical protein R2809_00340 [Flavobacteriales bacterium]